ncbi:MAG: SH3 domain-containing protein [Anaerolineales bacterium]|nr:SH3 domain-containing protein [Anaerolineales bacterium]
MPVVIFLILILGVGYLILTPFPTPTPTIEGTVSSVLTPTVSTSTPAKIPRDPTSPPPVSSTPPTATATPLIPIPTLTITPPPTDAPASSTPILTITPSPTPASPITGIVLPNNLNVRWGPGLEYGYAGAVYKGDEVVILRRTPGTDWLEVITPDNKKGWVGAPFIGDIDYRLSAVPVAVIVPPPPPPTTQPTGVTPFDLDGPSAFGSIDAGKERWYSFSEKNKETVLIFMFKPNLNGVQISIRDQNQINQWLTVGVGSLPYNDRDGDLNTVELVWRGGPLIVDKTYYVQLVNESQESIEYCLAPRDIDKWDCP